MSMSERKEFQLAIIGGGISGLTLAIALHSRNIPITVYEAAPHFGEIGAGVAFTPNALQSMKKCNEGIYNAFQKVCTRNMWPSKQKVWFDFVDGHKGTKDQETAFTIHSEIGQNGVHRARYLDELVKLVPDDIAQFGKRLVDITEGKDGKQVMHFQDDTTAEADAIIGCDGIKSRVRQFIVGRDHPSAHPKYTYKYAYRGLVPMEKAVAAVGAERAQNSTMHIGPNAHMLTFPVMQGKLLNIVAFQTTSEDWPEADKLTKPSTRKQALKDFEGWGHNVIELLKLTEENLDIWAIFDTATHPLKTYTKDRLMVTGDAAHATSPHHGAGAGFCIEDSAVLSSILASPCIRKPTDLEYAFATFDAVRRERTQWLVQSSRFIGDCYECRGAGVGADLTKIEREIVERNAVIGEVDVERLCQDAVVELEKRVRNRGTTTKKGKEGDARL